MSLLSPRQDDFFVLRHRNMRMDGGFGVPRLPRHNALQFLVHQHVAHDQHYVSSRQLFSFGWYQHEVSPDGLGIGHTHRFVEFHRLPRMLPSGKMGTQVDFVAAL